MLYLETYVYDKAGWTAGQWSSEPDKVQWQDPLSGIPCLIVRQRGLWSSYAGLNQTYTIYGQTASALDALLIVGGLEVTYAAVADNSGRPLAIVHTPEAGEPGGLWWVGVGACHDSELLTDEDPMLGVDDETYRNMRYAMGISQALAEEMRIHRAPPVIPGSIPP